MACEEHYGMPSAGRAPCSAHCAPLLAGYTRQARAVSEEARHSTAEPAGKVAPHRDARQLEAGGSDQ